MDDVTAYHESGHALMAVLVGGEVRSITIEPAHDCGPRRYGDTVVAWEHRKFRATELLEKQILVMLAGPVAEMIYTGEAFHPGFISQWAFDWKGAWQAAAALRGEARSRMALLESTCVQVHRDFSRDEVWSYLAELADQLAAHRTLEAAEIYEILDSWDRLFR